MAALLVVAKTVVTEHEITRIGDGVLGRSLVGLQGSQSHEGLVGRTRRVGPAQCAVEQRFVGREVELLPVLHVNTVYKHIGVECGFAHKRQHLAAARVQGNKRTASLPVHLLHQMLQLDIQREHHGVSGRGGVAR